MMSAFRRRTSLAGAAMEIEFTKEEIALKELRTKVKDVIREDEKFDDDLYLLQWLKAQKLNVDKAEKMLRSSVKWRKENGYNDALAEADFESEEKLMLYYFGAKSKEGVPVLLMDIGASDFRGFIDKFGRERYIRHSVQCLLKCEKLMIGHNKEMREKNLAKTNGRITSTSSRGIMGLFNVKNYSLKQSKSMTVIQAQLELTKIMLNYFPAIQSQAYFINVNKFFSIAFKVLKPVLTNPCLTMDLFGTDEEEWKAEISKQIDFQFIRSDFGGGLAI